MSSSSSSSEDSDDDESYQQQGMEVTDRPTPEEVAREEAMVRRIHTAEWHAALAIYADLTVDVPIRAALQLLRHKIRGLSREQIQAVMGLVRRMAHRIDDFPDRHLERLIATLLRDTSVEDVALWQSLRWRAQADSELEITESVWNEALDAARRTIEREGHARAAAEMDAASDEDEAEEEDEDEADLYGHAQELAERQQMEIDDDDDSDDDEAEADADVTRDAILVRFLKDQSRTDTAEEITDALGSMSWTSMDALLDVFVHQSTQEDRMAMRSSLQLVGSYANMDLVAYLAGQAFDLGAQPPYDTELATMALLCVRFVMEGFPTDMYALGWQAVLVASLVAQKPEREAYLDQAHARDWDRVLRQARGVSSSRSRNVDLSY